MRILFAPLFARLLILLRVIGPYAAIELLLPGGTFIALLYWWYRNRVILRAATDGMAIPRVTGRTANACTSFRRVVTTGGP